LRQVLVVMRASADLSRATSTHEPALARLRPRLADGAQTTVHVAAFPRRRVRLRVAVLSQRETLVRWCRRSAVEHAIVGGFFVRPHNVPLGEVRVDGRPVAYEPFLAPWNGRRACVHVDGAEVAIARRPDLPASPAGDLLQAGPLLVRDGARVFGSGDEEGFSAGAAQFDSDITLGRHPRSALGLTADTVLAVVCDGRHADDVGLSIGELADVLLALGARCALNLDGGGSSSLVCGGELVNRPREQHGVELLDGRPIATALTLSLDA
jgi:Phosphodiester glycosidase